MRIIVAPRHIARHIEHKQAMRCAHRTQDEASHSDKRTLSRMRRKTNIDADVAEIKMTTDIRARNNQTRESDKKMRKTVTHTIRAGAKCPENHIEMIKCAHNWAENSRTAAPYMAYTIIKTNQSWSRAAY